MADEKKERRKIKFSNFKNTNSDREDFKRDLRRIFRGRSDKALRIIYILISTRIHKAERSYMNADLKPAPMADVSRNLEALRSALEAVNKCFTTRGVLNYVYQTRNGPEWKWEDMPTEDEGPICSKIPVVDRAVIPEVQSMVSRLLKTCYLSGAADIQAVTQKQQGGNKVQRAEVWFGVWMARIYEVAGGKFSKMPGGGFDVFLKAVYNYIDPEYKRDANHQKLLRAIHGAREDGWVNMAAYEKMLKYIQDDV